MSYLKKYRKLILMPFMFLVILLVLFLLFSWLGTNDLPFKYAIF